METPLFLINASSIPFLGNSSRKDSPLSQLGSMISLVSTGLEQLDAVLGGEGYPEKSSILVAGPPGVGKEALGYWFTRSGLVAGDTCLYVTHLAVSEVLEDGKAFRISTDKLPSWDRCRGRRIKGPT